MAFIEGHTLLVVGFAQAAKNRSLPHWIQLWFRAKPVSVEQERGTHYLVDHLLTSPIPQNTLAIHANKLWVDEIRFHPFVRTTVGANFGPRLDIFFQFQAVEC